VIIVAAVLYHLRDDGDWEFAFKKIFALLRPGGSFWITDLVSHENAEVHKLMWRRYGEYLTAMGAEDYRDKVFAYIDQENSPRSVIYQLDLLKRVGFETIEILHKNSSFAAFSAVKSITCGVS
jgi:tRNA (cmo5U34)-methyltransferase